MYEGLVSIIMPSWNTGNYISESIQSVINQTYRNWELIIVDDCSTDKTDAVVESFNDDRIIYIKNEKNKGAAVTRNIAMRKARGEWIAFLDSDDLWSPEKLEHQIKFMNNHNLVFSYHEYVKIDEKSNSLGVYVTGPEIVTKRKMYNYGYPGCLTFMYNAKTLGIIQIKDIKKNNDYAILLQLCKKADCYLLRENLAKYRIRKNSISHDKLLKKLKSHFDLFHLCDEKSAPIAFWYACWNMFYGILKKRTYERKYASFIGENK
ncbi:glycosyltransferase family 2 protein [Enterococcus faecium]|uniref:glycosyltransferase family 2 protein n=1 Tax=Enterococcus faecium TaxID=1352 RepID=UPI00202CB6F6|nr:glycosyltransferase family 2 protein [Enterococcus faecium]MCL9978140.1 glycosyltransferase [Enterococcus faecium]MDQ8304525.1 glycosyltransferase family 2 protein [Enterococcus faecium]MDQ8428527.1 glycosyltransferase family 2 protein [Enterococcus faecium]